MPDRLKRIIIITSHAVGGIRLIRNLYILARSWHVGCNFSDQIVECWLQIPNFHPAWRPETPVAEMIDEARATSYRFLKASGF